MQFTIVSEEPLDSSGEFWATSVENNGESAITTRPQKNKNIISVAVELANRKNGEVMQHKHDSSKHEAAIFFTPKYCENIPLKIQASPPDAIIKKENKETLRLMPG